MNSSCLFSPADGPTASEEHIVCREIDDVEENALRLSLFGYCTERRHFDLKSFVSISCQCCRRGSTRSIERPRFVRAVQAVVQACSVNVDIAKIKC